jgi:hypothetical protein
MVQTKRRTGEVTTVDELITTNEHALLQHLVPQSEGDHGSHAGMLKLYQRRGLGEDQLIAVKRRLADWGLVALHNPREVETSEARLTPAGWRKISQFGL